MVRYSRPFCFLGLLVVLAAAPVFAHHGAASVYNPNKKITLTGTVTKLLWANPHIEIYFDAKDPETGKVVSWELGDGQAPNGLYRKGWKKDDLKPGDTITVTDATMAWTAGSYRIGGGIITNAAGRKIFYGSANDGL